MIRYSLILNSRGRPQHLNSLLQSLVDTTSDISSIEVIVGLDKDDPSLEDSLNILLKFGFPLLWVGDRPPNLIGAINRLSRLASGRYVFVLNDDVIFETTQWDSVAWATLQEHSISFPDGIVYGRTHDISVDKDKDGKYAAFPIISKKAIDVLGFAVPDRYYSLGGDVITYRIYEKLDRVVDLSNIILKHTLHQTIEQVCNPDQTAYEMRLRTHQGKTDWKTYNIDDFVWRLQNYLNNFKKNEYNISKERWDGV